MWKRFGKYILIALALMFFVLPKAYELFSEEAKKCVAKGGEYHSWGTRDFRAPNGAACYKVTITEIK